MSSELEVVKDLLNNKTFIDKENELLLLNNIKRKYIDTGLTIDDPRWIQMSSEEKELVNKYKLRQLKYDIRTKQIVTCDDELCNSLYNNPLVDYNYPGKNLTYRLRINNNQDFNSDTHPFFMRIHQLESELLSDREKLMNALGSLSITTSYTQCVNNIDIRNIANSTINLDNIQQAVTCIENIKENFIFPKEKMKALELGDIIDINDANQKRKKEKMTITPYSTDILKSQRDPRGIPPTIKKETMILDGTMVPGPIVMIDPSKEESKEGFNKNTYHDNLAKTDMQRTPSLIADISRRNKEWYPERFANYGSRSDLESPSVYEKIKFEDNSSIIKKMEQTKKKDTFVMPKMFRKKYSLAEFVEIRNKIYNYITDEYKRLSDCAKYFIEAMDYLFDIHHNDIDKINEMFYNDQNLIKIKEIFNKIDKRLDKKFIVFDDFKELMYFYDIYGGNESLYAYNDLYNGDGDCMIILDGQMQIFTSIYLNAITSMNLLSEITALEKYYKDKALFYFIITKNPNKYSQLNHTWYPLKTTNGKHSISYKNLNSIFRFANGNVDDNIMLLVPPKELFTVTLE